MTAVAIRTCVRAKVHGHAYTKQQAAQVGLTQQVVFRAIIVIMVMIMIVCVCNRDHGHDHI